MPSNVQQYLKKRKQRVVLNGQITPWTGVNMGVPKGPLLRSLVFLLRRNNLTGGLSSNFTLFTEDMSLIYVGLYV